MAQARPGGFSDVDHQEEISFFINILEAQDRQPGIMRARAAALEMLDPRPGMRILDAGCGLGTATIEIASRIRPGGCAVGLDISERMLDIARTKSKDAGVDVDLVGGDISRLQFGSDSFDGARAERVLQHLADPEKALAEMVRVVRPGGRVVVADTDWDSMVVDLPDIELVAKLRAASLRRFTSPTIGRRLYGMFKRAGLVDVAVEPVTALFLEDVIPGTNFKPGEMTVMHAVEDGGLTQAEADVLLSQMRAAAEEGAVFIALTMYAVSGTVR